MYICRVHVLCINSSCVRTSDDSAGDIVSPQKSVQQVTRESQEGKELYKKSHNDYEVGE